MGDNAFDIHSLPKCDNLFELGRQIGSGVSSKVYQAIEKQTGRKLAVKIVKLTEENEEFLREECSILTHLPKHDNVVDLYGIYICKNENAEEIWIVMELCLGTVIDFVREMHGKERTVEDSHLSYILRGLMEAIVHLHENRVIHRDVRGSNVLVSKCGEIRLTDFGLSKVMKNESDKAIGSIGSPSWMAPEMIPSGSSYDNRVDVWAMGITAMELADGTAPFENMHPARALFQILKNPPPALIQLSNRSQILNDFINECLEKNPENRPVIQEFREHPLFQQDSTTNVRAEIINVLEEFSRNDDAREKKCPEILIRDGYMKVENQKEEKILHGDLAMLEDVKEDEILRELEERLKKKSFCTFIGDILIVLNPNEDFDIYDLRHHEKYRFKARSDNAPHIYSVADSAYQDMLHHDEPQQILITGETMSGKTRNMLHILDHLLFLGQGNKCGQNVRKSVDVIHALGNAATSANPNSTRHILQTQVSFTAAGKTSGAIFWLYQLEKNRVTSTDRDARNFHIFYYFFHGLRTENKLEKYFLESEKNYEFLKTSDKNSEECAEEFGKFEENLKDLGFEEEQLISIRRVLAAIMILGEVEFGTDADGNAKLGTQNEADAVADLLGLDQKKFSWALLKYCVILKGEAAMRHHTESEATEAKNVLARGLYFRVVDWIINYINEKLSIPRAIYGDKHTVNVLDLFGFECSNTNTIDQLIINCMNEQLQYYYNQKIFFWEMKNAEEEEITMPNLHFIDNKVVMDQILAKSDGLMHAIEEATKSGGLQSFAESVKTLESSHILPSRETDFSIAHYTGKITYTSSEILDKNRDFLPPEMIDTMRRSSNDNIRKLFTGLLTATGNLTMHSGLDKMDNREGRWNTGFSSGNKKFRGRKFNTSSKGQYSQSRQMRTAISTFRATCIEILRSLTSNENNVHFVRCIRTNLTNSPMEFNRELVRQQTKAFGCLETVLARQKGYSYRVTFSDFIRRYQFLAFDFNESVEETKENCRLLLIRLKMEGWIIGKTKVFLKYYDKEYLSRLYGINVRKIVKVQSMMRAFLARKKLRAKIKRFQEDMGVKDNKESVDSQSIKNYKDQKNEEYEEEEDFNFPLRYMEDLDGKTIDFIKPWFRKWKTQSIYQVLLLYRSTQERNFVYFCHQVHLYNQNGRSLMESLNEDVDLSKIDVNFDCRPFIPKKKISVHKAPFRLCDLTYGSSNVCDSVNEERDQKPTIEEVEWDAPMKFFLKKEILSQNNLIPHEDKECQTDSHGDTKHTSLKEDDNPPSVAQSTAEEPINNTDTNEKEFTALQSNGVESENEELSNRVNSLKHIRKPPKYMGIPPKRSSPVTETNNFPFSRETQNTDHHLPKYRSPIRELEEKFRKKQKTSDDVDDNDDDGDDPPYNFRAMLRKTNYAESAGQKQTEPIINTYDFTLKKLKQVQKPKNERLITSTILAPGLIIQGEIADL